MKNKNKQMILNLKNDRTFPYTQYFSVIGQNFEISIEKNVTRLFSVVDSSFNREEKKEETRK